MVLIPAGTFWMGCNSPEHCYPDEEPYRQFTHSTYEIDKYEVTRARFSECVSAGACSAPDLDLTAKRNHPVLGVSWPQADGYCRWRGKHLPTDAQWERAARGTDGAAYPWGNALPDCGRCNFDNCVGDTAPVGSYPAGASAEGVMDLSGNVWEWTSDSYSETFLADAATHDPVGPATGLGYTYRGGHFRSSLERMDVWLRYYPDGTDADNRRPKGFRCAR